MKFISKLFLASFLTQTVFAVELSDLIDEVKTCSSEHGVSHEVCASMIQLKFNIEALEGEKNVLKFYYDDGRCQDNNLVGSVSISVDASESGVQRACTKIANRLSLLIKRYGDILLMEIVRILLTLVPRILRK